jgi:cephalosporin-C deacetylase
MSSFPHSYPYDPTYGFTLSQLREIAPPKPFPEYEAFWRETYLLARNATSTLECQAGCDYLDGHEILTVSFRTWDERIIRGWLAIPLAETPVCAVVVGHGYQGRTGPTIPSGSLPAIRLFYCTRGIGASKSADIPEHSRSHVLHGIESREGYVLRGCAADLWGAVGALLEYAPEFRDRLFYAGKSFGGGIGALAVPWDPRIARCYLGQPTFGNHPFRLQVPCKGSGEAVRLHAMRNPEAIKTLGYFDAAVSASYLKIPTLVSCSLFDPSVPPPGQFSVYNAIGSQKELFIEPAGHFGYPEEEATAAALLDRLNRWFTAV